MKIADRFTRPGGRTLPTGQIREGGDFVECADCGDELPNLY
jgi:hypothetical protein